MVFDIGCVQEFIHTCTLGFQQGWHERNGGNLTYRLHKDELAQLSPFFCRENPWVSLGVQAQNLAGEYFLATGSGKYFSNVARKPEDTLCILEINDRGDAYRIVWGLINGGRPTSEFPTHFMNHAVRVLATDGACRVIYHAHPANIIALTYVLPLEDRVFSRVLWQSATECPVVFPGGVGVVPWMVPGGSKIALATCEKMKEFDAAVWAHHGLFCSGPDFDTTFGLMHTIEKAAQIYLLAQSSGKEFLQTIGEEDLRAIAKEFGVKLREDFLLS